MINRRSLLGSFAALFSGFGVAVAQTVGYVRKVYLTVHSDKKDEQYGLENGSIEIHNQDTGKIRKIRVSDGIIISSKDIVYKKQIGGLIPNSEDTIPVKLYDEKSFICMGKIPNRCIQGDYVVIPTRSGLTIEDVCKLRCVEYTP